jgi:hypothetical protein
MLKLIVFFFGVFFSLQLQAFRCFLTLVKDNCWTNYNVSVPLTSVTTGKLIANLNIPQGESWTRQAFECQPLDTVSVSASFTPATWKTDEGKSYPGRHTWQLPDKVATQVTAWNITVCYPADFLSVPYSLDDTGNCQCEMDNIPPVKPQ